MGPPKYSSEGKKWEKLNKNRSSALIKTYIFGNFSKYLYIK